VLHIGIITLFPEMFNILQQGVSGKALEKKLVQLERFYLRDYTQDARKTVDDRPYGGGPGMVMMVQPLRDAIHAAKKKLGEDTLTVYLSPQGKPVYQQQMVSFVESKKPLLLIAGRYEGIDERLIEQDIDQEWSMGDIVLSGGEIPAMAIIDAMIRLVPGALGDETSAKQDTFEDGLLEYPHYTRPRTLESLDVPEVLLRGNHRDIIRWRLKHALGRTWLKRPDLLDKLTLTSEQIILLQEFIEEL